MYTSAIILMGGQGDRFGRETPKQFARLAGKEIFLHTLHTFEASQLFDEIILVCPEDWIAHTKNLVNGTIRIIPGGLTRQASSRCGIEATNKACEILLIHDGVRPFVSQKVLHANIEAARIYGAVDTCIPTTDTIVQGSDFISNIPDRTTLFRGQTPQTFQKKLLFEAHQRTLKQNATDDCQLVHDLSLPVHIVLGDEKNIKITTELDLILAEQIIRTNTSPSPKISIDLSGKTYAITGGTGGLGMAVAALLKKHGATPLLLSPSSKEYPVDLTDYEAVRATFAKRPLDGLINCMGYLSCAPLSAMSPYEIQKTINTNFTALTYACQLALIKPHGHIINVASSSYSRGRKGYALYSASKAAVVNFTQALSEEREDLIINTIIPPRMNTPMRTENFPPEENLLEPTAVAEEILTILSSTSSGILYEIKQKAAFLQEG